MLMNVLSAGIRSKPAEYLISVLKKIFYNPKYLLLSFGVIGIALSIVLITWLQSSNYQVLYTNISDQDSGDIISELSTLNIPYKFSKNNGSIMVPEDKIYETRFLLAQKNLPKGGSIGFEILDNSSFGISQFNENINYQRALEGEIARTIETINSIKSARVHIAIPKSSVFIRDNKPSSASITLGLHAGRTLDKNEIQAIRWLVSGTVPNLPVSNIVLVDNYGKLLAYPDNNNDDKNITQLQYIKDIELEYRRRIEEILIPIVGFNNVKAEVTAQIDFTKTEQTSEKHKPNTNPNEMSIRSQQITENNNFSQVAEGVPGALSNQPSQVSSANIDEENEEIDKDAESEKEIDKKNNSSSKVEKPNNVQKEKIINYEIDRTLTHSKFSTGILKRLSVAVVINKKEDQKGNQINFEEKEMQEITSLIKEVMGYSEERNDTLDVVNANFVNKKDEIFNIPFWENIRIQNIFISLIKYILSFALMWLFINKFIKIWKTSEQNQLKNKIDKKSFQEKNNSIVNEKNNEINKKINEEENISIYTENSIKKLQEIADKQPKLVAKIISQWIKKEQNIL
ncbi:fliF [Wigglesworthia glossinidia endosymbiont of Glossina brevipalpis]|uniref:Flagellar M-ring protein n=1 Tax=Wigglesworthia glossinidia brevipalpis TaxID=36870 RepID=Q8D3E1_WIGBR|nr:fliF [Wigglesworthia glossinidia endosymbiont of Glossina brevipalpis]